jgi:tRNA-binding protein
MVLWFDGVLLSNKLIGIFKMEDISWNDFAKVALHVGTIIEVEDFPEARNPAYKVRIDFGKDIGIKKSSAQITDLYDRESLIGRQVVAVVNFPPKQIGPMRSECLITGFHREDGAVVLAVPDSNVPNGTKLA